MTGDDNTPPMATRRVFRPRLVLSLIALVMFVLLIMLGNWQKRRYFEAIDGLAHHHDQHDVKASVKSLDEVQEPKDSIDRLKAYQFRRAELFGTLEVAKTQLLTARYMFGKRGYGIMMPLLVSSVGPYKRILVHLGWVPQEQVKTYLQEVAQSPEQTIKGRLQITRSAPKQKPTGVFLEYPTWLRPYPLGMHELIEDMEPRLMLQSGNLAIGKPVDPNQLPLTGYAHPVRLNPNKHIEYAGTWYGLALTLVFVWIALSLKKVAASPVSEQSEDNV